MNTSKNIANVAETSRPKQDVERSARFTCAVCKVTEDMFSEGLGFEGPAHIMVKSLEYLRVYLKSVGDRIETRPKAPAVLPTERLTPHRPAIPSR